VKSQIKNIKLLLLWAQSVKIAGSGAPSINPVLCSETKITKKIQAGRGGWRRFVKFWLVI